MDVSTNVEALELTLAELDAKGRLSSIDAAHMQMLRTMAGALDAEKSNAALWRQYREALGELMDDDAGDDDDAAGLFSKVGDAKTP